TTNSKIEAPAIAPAPASFPTLDGRPPERRLPKIKSSVAPSISHGSTRINVWAGVFSSRTAPAAPPSKLVAISGVITRWGTSSRLRYAPPLAVRPVQRYSGLVAFVGIGGAPEKSRAGNEM